MSSRLFIEVRERRGLAYSVYATTEYYKECGYLAAKAGVEHKNLNETIKVIIEEYKKIIANGVSEKELQRSKDFLKGKSVMGLESSDEVAMFFIDQELKKKNILTPDDIFKKIDAVTTRDIMRVARQIFKTETLNLAIIGPHKDGKKFEKLLKI
jgi:predicted Zn-dependent peptidase